MGTSRPGTFLSCHSNLLFPADQRYHQHLGDRLVSNLVVLSLSQHPPRTKLLDSGSGTDVTGVTRNRNLDLGRCEGHER